MHYIIMCRSLTYAQKAARRLQDDGIFASVTKAPQGANPKGCTYGVKIGERNLRRAIAALNRAEIPIGQVFSLDFDGSVGEVLL